ncbi:receptor-type tyrosine-protein phosphatase H-like [Solea solea]|uniref:receptor-type tyrosine-protein phosphatase H-like n=1 Tax=Solea solea TaxID=90069 RepID=UPI00272C8865|nr:receptor-type tyrosine-protein phosphatase H-like [Solea solea]
MSSFTSVPDLNTTNMTSFTSVPDLNTTNMSSFTSVPDLNMTNMTSFTSVPDLNTTNMSSFTSVPDQDEEDFTTMAPPLPVEGDCVCSPMLLHTDLEPDEDYIEDSCVAMLSFGPWVEKSCSDLLPFFCYEDRFFGHVNVTNVTCGGASLSWLLAPDGISHYRVEVTGDKQMTEIQTNLTTDLFNLTAGTLYSVQVIPVKCERDLNPQEVSFYTIPNKVRNLTLTNVTERSVFLMWNKPAGNSDFYLIVVDDEKNNRSNTEGTEFDGLMPGSLYTFTVLTGVRDNITLSEGSSISTYTKPGKVSDLCVTENTNISLLLSWMPPEGHSTSFCVQAVDDSNYQWFDQEMNYNSTQTRQQLKVTGLPMGSRITLSVTALVNGTLKGDKVTIVNYTAPGPISNLILQTTHNSLCATWTPSSGNCSYFAVILQLDGENVTITKKPTEPVVEVSSLKTAAKYTVLVSCVSGHLHSPQVQRSKFTLPSPPTDAKVVSANKSHITFQWKAPESAVRGTRYAVHLNSSFWGHNQSELSNKTTYTFGNLKSGTNYMFEVRTVTDEARSPQITTSHFTESEEIEIGLSMMCSSTSPLLCANATSEESIILQLEAHFNQLLGHDISWNLKKQEQEDTA